MNERNFLKFAIFSMLNENGALILMNQFHVNIIC